MIFTPPMTLKNQIKQMNAIIECPGDDFYDPEFTNLYNMLHEQFKMYSELNALLEDLDAKRPTCKSTFELNFIDEISQEVRNCMYVIDSSDEPEKLIPETERVLKEIKERIALLFEDTLTSEK